jgi:hypothetical protein
VIDVAGAAGAAEADLQRIARDSGYWPFRHCYEDGLRRDQDLSGNVSLTLDISSTGNVERSMVMASTLSDRIVVACLAREARQLSFSGIDTGATAATEITLGAGDEPVSICLPVARARELQQALRTGWPAAEACYAKARAANPDLGGRVEVLFRVSGATTTEVSRWGPGAGDSELGACVVEAYRAARLALPYNGHERRFVYALHFETDPTQPSPSQ